MRGFGAEAANGNEVWLTQAACKNPDSSGSWRRTWDQILRKSLCFLTRLQMCNTFLKPFKLHAEWRLFAIVEDREW